MLKSGAALPGILGIALILYFAIRIGWSLMDGG